MDPLQRLLSANSSSSGEELKQLGLEAAAVFLRKEGSLNSTIAKIANEKDLNPEQINRVLEAANNAVFKQRFEKQASKVVTFPVADPKVIAELRGKKVKTASPTVHSPKQSYIPGASAMADLEDQLFPSQGLSKIAYAAPNKDVEKAYFDLKGHTEYAQNKLSEALTKVSFCQERLWESTRQAVLSGEGTVHEICDVISQAGEASGIAKRASSFVLERLVELDMISPITVGHQKLAHRTYDPSHPIAVEVRQWGSAEKTASVQTALIGELAEGLEALKAYLAGKL